eukprot:6376745-Prymnesium_polylepis.5
MAARTLAKGTMISRLAVCREGGGNVRTCRKIGQKLQSKTPYRISTGGRFERVRYKESCVSGAQLTAVPVVPGMQSTSAWTPTARILAAIRLCRCF